MLSRNYHVATIPRWIALASALTLGACAARGGDREQMAATPALAPDTATTAREGYIVDAEEFALVTSSAGAKTISLAALQAAASNFEWLFGDRAPHIGVVVMEGKLSASNATPVMPEDLTTVMVMAANLSGPDAAGAAKELTAALHIMTADAWIHDYADEWTPNVNADGTPEEDAVESVASAESLPHWLRVGSLRLLAEGHAASGTPRLSAQSSLPMNALLAYRLRPEQVALVSRLLHRAPDADGGADAKPDDSADVRFALGFIRQSASVLRYLRETEGDTATADLFGAATNGMSIEQILSLLPHPMTVEALDRDWRSWVAERSALVATQAVR